MAKAAAPTKARPQPTRKTAVPGTQPEITARRRRNAESEVAEENLSVSKGGRASKQKALNNAVWRNAAPMGSRKRPSSPTMSQPVLTKKAKAPPVARNSQASQVQAMRKPPAVITSDSDNDENGAVQHEPAFRPARASLQVKTPESYDDEDNSLSDVYQQSDEEELEDDDDELEGLDPKSLKSTLAGERPYWAADEDDLDTEGLPPAEGRDSTTDTEVDELDVEQASDIDGQYPGIPNDEEVVQQWSKRALARQAEVPKWHNTNTQQAAGLSGTPTTRSAPSNITSVDNDNHQWPAEAHYIPPQSGSRNLSLTAQPTVIYTVIKAAIRRVIGDALFVDAYPSPASFDDYLRSISMDIAEELEYSALFERLKVDTVLVEYISRLLSTRLSNIRCSAKKITLPKVETSYGLGSGVSVEDRRDIVKKLLSSGDYIFPRTQASFLFLLLDQPSICCLHRSTQAGLILRTKPFHHPIIISSLRECYFSAARGSMASKHVSRFSSIIDDGPLSMELEVPAPMLCMVATATYAAIEDWGTGYLKKSEFNSDAYEDVYRGHELFLENIRTDKRRAYHRLMADLYQEAAQSHAGHSAKAIANNSMAILDLAGMDE